MRPMRILVTIFIAILTQGPALADGQSATRNLFTNLARSRFDTNGFLATLGTNINVITVMPSLVRGMYTIQKENNGSPILFTNQDGTILGARDAVFLIPIDGSSIRKMNNNELFDLRKEIMSNIYYDKLLLSRFGNGGGRRILLHSAIDCPSCRELEQVLSKQEKTLQSRGSSINTTFYIIPSSLQELEPDGWNSWISVSNLWCAGDVDNAWKNYWSRKIIPKSDIGHCPFSPREAARVNQSLGQILAGVTGAAYYPLVIREDGAIVKFRDTKIEEYGPQGLPQVISASSRWLESGEVESSFKSRPIGKPDQNAGNTNKSVIKLDSLIKGLFK